jgi:hypothetical protein
MHLYIQSVQWAEVYLIPERIIHFFVRTLNACLYLSTHSLGFVLQNSANTLIFYFYMHCKIIKKLGDLVRFHTFWFMDSFCGRQRSCVHAGIWYTCACLPAFKGTCALYKNNTKVVYTSVCMHTREKILQGWRAMLMYADSWESRAESYFRKVQKECVWMCIWLLTHMCICVYEYIKYLHTYEYMNAWLRACISKAHSQPGRTCSSAF